ncbi:ubiquinone biosynthesis protein UbiB [Desulfuromonas versatilis]|uniref:Ubiquinone biosynthesis protein UbiB n=1 Tax=Desulfuromonas versatilis TaxID=2802975 RepID=A0ABN6DXB8_9BACT|nr:2-polyprenylphenol 6-hydroxylase [Desulfuromonas versatilis]BCR04179.1 ubiquinone biosynthesis protein UbiB [Desulfuromonas versatilis]
MLTFSRINRNIRSIRRYRNILGILIKYGFGHVVEQLNINYYLELGKKIVTLGTAPKEIERLTQPERLRLAMVELGPTFIKLGQILSTRPDIIPREYADEFRKLQDKVPAIPLEEIQEQIQRQLGYPVAELFAEFSPVPIAAASIAQVHKARLNSGEHVVVKVRRPGIEKVIETDLDILMGLAYLIEHHIPTGEIYDPIGVVKEFRRTIHREMDFSREGHTIDRFAANFAEDETVYVPKVFWEATGEGVLTMELVEGIKISDFDRLAEAGLDRKIIARNGADAILNQVLVHGLFHGDPHPGNIFVLDENRVCFIDYGMVGRVDDDLKNQLIDLLVNILQRDVDAVISQLLYSGEVTDEVNLKALKRDLGELIDAYYEIPLQEINAGKLLVEFIEILTSYQIKFPADLMLLGKALVTIEGIGRQLDPDFNMVEHLRPFMTRMVRDRLSPTSLSKELFRVAQSYSALAKNLPRDLKEFINRVNRNKFKIDLEHRGLEKLINDLDKSSNRLSFSLIIAALIIGSSLIMQTEKGPMLLGFPALGILGYSIAGFLGLWLAIAILRSGRL